MTREELYELKHKRAQLVEEGKGLLAKKDLEGHGAKMAEIDQLNGEINAAEKQLAEEGRFEDGEGASRPWPPPRRGRRMRPGKRRRWMSCGPAESMPGPLPRPCAGAHR